MLVDVPRESIDEVCELLALRRPEAEMQANPVVCTGDSSAEFEIGAEYVPGNVVCLVRHLAANVSFNLG
jgi:hypothetical protein